MCFTFSMNPTSNNGRSMVGNPENFADVIYGWSLSSSSAAHAHLSIHIPLSLIDTSHREGWAPEVEGRFGARYRPYKLKSVEFPVHNHGIASYHSHKFHHNHEDTCRSLLHAIWRALPGGWRWRRRTGRAE